MPKLKINNQEVEVEPGTSLLHAARDMGIEVPTLCYWEGVRPMNSCMLCVMRESRSGQLLPSCSTIAADGMEIETDSGDVCAARKDVLELTISEHVGDCEAPCAHTCPASMNIPVMMRQIYDGEFDEAAYTVTEGLVFPWTLGYVCPAPCESPCRRKSYDTTMEIRQLHRTVAQRAQTENPELLECPPDTGHSVGIIGGGLTGMAAAWVLRKSGHACTIYEEDDKAGGRWRHLPEEEFPLHVLDAEVAQIEKLGVQFEYGHCVNGDLESLVEKHDAIIGACPDVVTPGGKIFEAKEHKLAVRAVGNGKTTAAWVDRYLKSNRPNPEPKLFLSKYGKLPMPDLEKMREQNENTEAMEVVETELKDLVDSQTEAGRCLHCDCRKRVSCGLRKWASEYGAEKKKYKGGEEQNYEIVGVGDVMLEPGKCIRCGLCVAISEKYDESIGLAFIGRGFEMEIKVPFDKSLDDGLKKSAAECVEACPTAAISFRNKEDILQCHTTAWIEL